MIKAAKSGGHILKKYFGQELEARVKLLVSDVVTKADLESESIILKILSDNFPNYNILSEESGQISRKSDRTFIVDPLDGSHNFTLGIPYFSISIALLIKNEIKIGIVYDPILNRTYFAKKRGGSFLDRQRLRVSKESELKNSNIAFTCDYVNAWDAVRDKIMTAIIKKKIKRYLENWSPALDLCLLASGKIDALIVNKNELYDYAAGKLIVKEAGALITDFGGQRETDERNNTFLASNGTKIHNQILEIL